MMKKLLLLGVVSLSCRLFAQVQDFIPTDYAQTATIRTTKGVAPLQAVDQNLHSFWESEAPLPENYIYKRELNAFHPKAYPRILRENAAFADTDLNTAVTFNKKNQDAVYGQSFKLLQAVESHRLSIKTGNNEAVRITITYTDESIFMANILPENQYSLVAVFPEINKLVKQISIESSAPFQLFEIACLSKKPFVDYTLELEKPVSIGQIYSRHFNGEMIDEIQFLSSADGNRWTTLGTANPEAIGLVPLVVQNENLTKYFKVRFLTENKDYAKASLWELKLFDKAGPFGKKTSFKPSPQPLINRIGLNMVWGWGQHSYSDELNTNAGWRQFQSVFKKLRLYHFLYWDIPKPGVSAAYENMKQAGTAATWWLNWDREYDFLNEKGFDILATLLFKNNTFPDSTWPNPSQNAYAIGYDFALHFGRNKTVEAVEAGNEPWDYPPEFYRQICVGMLKGFEDANNATRRLPAAFQATFPAGSFNDHTNFVADFLDPSVFGKLHALNTHLYAYANNSIGELIAVAPEDPRAELNGIRNMIRFRNEYAPEAEIWVTEFGYDSEGGGEACTHSNCISEQKQAAWGIRAALKLLKEGADRVYWYFYANEDTDSYLHSRSGLTASANHNFAPKASYYAIKKLMKVLGNSMLTEVVDESDSHSIYNFKDVLTGQNYLVAWLHHGQNPENEMTVKHERFLFASQCMVMNGSSESEWKTITAGTDQQLSGYPTIFKVNQ
ncbi:MAG: hypothetical protein PHN50_10935 [Bacteroidales bacterium]|nr:hypothetical protein [Bacteroidales bacterium]